MMASSSETPRTFHVFISFRGPDVRNTFLGHLYEALVQRGIHTYIDEEKLEKGECISPALMKAINESRIAVVIFSEKYAESHWCLEELAEIMECKKRNNLIVLPVFYKVEPREVRGRRKSYGDAMAKHECTLGKDSEKLKKWKEALENAGSLSGWDLKNDGNEAKLVEDIVKKISDRRNPTSLHVTEYAVGLDSRVGMLKSMLSMGSEDDVRMVGLWGPGGIGKTTIAKATYNQIFKKFAGSSFIECVQEKANDLVSLQNQLLFQILGDKNLTIFSVHEGIALMKERLPGKKVLVVLDDVKDLKQLKMLAGALDWFGKGSLIIITTRDRHLLTSHGVNHIFEVKPLNDREVRKLFYLHCFRKSQSIEISEDIIQSALHYTEGFPLAVEVLGAFLCGRNETEWTSTLAKLESSPEQAINRVLKVSFDALDRNEKEIFLDIACFFKGCKAEYVKKVLDSCDFHTTIGIAILIERALMRNENGTLQMHDLIQLMGRDIAYQECPDDPNKRSRVWFYNDVLEVLSGDMGTDKIKAIGLALPSPEEITINPNVFTGMKRLRLLILLNIRAYFVTPICLYSELRWLQWPKYAASTLKLSSGQKKLVGLDISNSRFKEPRVITEFKNLKFLYLSGCKLLVNIPDLSSSPNLKILDLSGCKNLVEVHQSVGYLDKLENLSLENCSKLSRFLDILKTKSLIELMLRGCSGLERFPEIPEQMDCWRTLDLWGTAIKEVPASIENGISLEKIDLSCCRNLTTLPSSVYKLNRLKLFNLENCSRFIHFPKKVDDSADPHGSLGFGALEILILANCNMSEVEFLDNLSCFPALWQLYLSGNNISSLPSSINKRDHLMYFDVDKCGWLREIPELPSRIYEVAADNGKSLCRVHKLPRCHYGPITANFSLCPQSLNVTDILTLEEISDQTGDVEIIVSGDEMPSWMVPVDGVCDCFYDSRLSPSECLGLALCAAFYSRDRSARLRFRVFNTRHKHICWRGERLFHPHNFTIGSDCVWFLFMPSSSVFPEYVDEADRGYCVGMEIEPWHGTIVKKWGWGIIWKDGRDDSNAVVLHQRLTKKRKIMDVSSSGPNYSGRKRLTVPDDCTEDTESEGDDKTDSNGDDSVSKKDDGGDDSEFNYYGRVAWH